MDPAFVADGNTRGVGLAASSVPPETGVDVLGAGSAGFTAVAVV